MNENGEWLNLARTQKYSQRYGTYCRTNAPFAWTGIASKLFQTYRTSFNSFTNLSNNGNEVCFATIGDASTSEGHFWETINAAGVLQVPLAVFVWDDGYGISVPKKYQTTKGSISEALSGMQKKDDTNGINIYKVKGWDYAGMCEVFEEGIRLARETHTPVLFHVEEITQPQGHSTSGSHERYKTQERLEWEREWDCLKKCGNGSLKMLWLMKKNWMRLKDKAKNRCKRKQRKGLGKIFAPDQDSGNKSSRN